MKNGARSYGNLIGTIFTLKQAPCFNEIPFVMVTFRADETVWPALFNQIIETPLFCGKTFLKLKKINRIIHDKTFQCECVFTII